MKSVSILGAGMAGFGAASQLFEERIPTVIYEKESFHGGHTASFVFDEGFVFDVGPHVSFTKDARIRDLFAKSVNQEYKEIPAKINNYWKGQWIWHPAQLNLYGLPPELVVKVLKDFIDEWKKEAYSVNNYADWLIANLGRTFAETFPMEYTVKYHTTTAENLTTDWIGPRMYKPKIEEVLLGALTEDHPIIHYVTEFRYPSRDGFVSYLKMFLKKTELKIGHQVTKIDSGRKELFFSDGKVTGYNALISSIPLPDLIPMITGVPTDVRKAAGKLACSGCVIVNIGIDRKDISEAQISYFYDRDIIFSRLSFPHMFSPHNVPSGMGSIQVEIYFSPKYKPLDRSPKEFIPLVIADLRRCGIIRDRDKLTFSNAIYAPYANVIFDHDRANALKAVHGYLEDVGVAYCGRYGDWAYMWTDESFISGERAARKILNGF